MGRTRVGKSGGARVVYFYYDPGHPLLLAVFYAKAARADITPTERKTLRAMATDAKRAFRKGN